MNHTLATWREANPGVNVERLEGGALLVFSMSPWLWRLENWVVSSVVSGPAVVLIRRECGWYTAHGYSEHSERWFICQDYTGAYMSRSGQWGRAGEAVSFGSQLEAEKAALVAVRLIAIEAVNA